MQSFLVLANYYDRFIVNYNTKARPLIYLTKGDSFSYEHIQQQAFDELWAWFLSAPILPKFDRTFKAIIETDTTK